MNKYVKFAALMTVIVGTLIWLASASMPDTQTYYKTIKELNALSGKERTKRLRVAGDIEKGSIVRKGDTVEFALREEGNLLRVSYTGRDPLPDTFKDGAQALADGRMGPGGVFEANKIQAKCSSKYAAKPGEAPAGLKAVAPSKSSI